MFKLKKYIKKLKTPLISNKSILFFLNNKYCFSINKKFSKKFIKNLLEYFFKIQILNVNNKTIVKRKKKKILAKKIVIIKSYNKLNNLLK